MNHIKIFKAGIELPLQTFVFPAGEVGLKLDTTQLNYLYAKAPYQTILARVQNSADIMALALAKDALARFDPTPIRLVLPYVPYSRQDRACVKGESFSLKVFADLINSLGFERVTVLDPHSYVTEGVFDRLYVIDQKTIIHRFDAFDNRVRSQKSVLVSPDSGANKKTSDLAAYFDHSAFVRADKLRDLATGNIKETIVYADDLSGSTVVICDDIGDGMRTFIELAKVLKAKRADKVILYITHGIFSKGADVLYDNGIDEVYTTTSFQETFDPRVVVLPIEPFVL